MPGYVTIFTSKRNILTPCVSSPTNSTNFPAAVLAVFLIPLLKVVDPGAAKRTRLGYPSVRLGEGAQARTMYGKITTWNASAVNETELCSALDSSSFGIGPEQCAVLPWIAAWT